MSENQVTESNKIELAGINTLLTFNALIHNNGEVKYIHDLTKKVEEAVKESIAQGTIDSFSVVDYEAEAKEYFNNKYSLSSTGGRKVKIVVMVSVFIPYDLANDELHALVTVYPKWTPRKKSQFKSDTTKLQVTDAEVDEVEA